MGKESGICIPSTHKITELSCKFGKQGTFMDQDIYHRMKPESTSFRDRLRSESTLIRK